MSAGCFWNLKSEFFPFYQDPVLSTFIYSFWSFRIIYLIFFKVLELGKSSLSLKEIDDVVSIFQKLIIWLVRGFTLHKLLYCGNINLAIKKQGSLLSSAA